MHEVLLSSGIIEDIGKKQESRRRLSENIGLTGRSFHEKNTVHEYEEDEKYSCDHNPFLLNYTTCPYGCVWYSISISLPPPIVVFVLVARKGVHPSYTIPKHLNSILYPPISHAFL